MTTRRIADTGEFGFLAALLPHIPHGRDTVVGPGQDCAVIRCGSARFLFTVDALVEGTHFAAGWMSARQIGRKSFLVNASDVAAMGGQPRFCVVSLGVPPTYAVRALASLEAGIVAGARACGADVVGGNLARTRQLSVSIALLARAPRRLVTRAGARPGDRIYVTGTVGDAALGVRVLRQGGARRGGAAHLLRRFREPAARLVAGRVLVEAGIASAMIDVSDGLLQDLGHLCAASGVGALLHTERLPLSAAYRRTLGAADPLALHGGEDYELLCTVPERNVHRLERHRSRLGCPITCIGVVTAARRLRVLGPGSTPVRLAAGGYDHFRAGG